LKFVKCKKLYLNNTKRRTIDSIDLKLPTKINATVVNIFKTFSRVCSRRRCEKKSANLSTKPKI
jgi:hypothetical protein